MRKIMIVIDDFKEQRAVESFLRRLGFDVLSLAKDILVNDALLRFHPEIVLATSKGRMVDGVRLAGRIKKLTPTPRMALLCPHGQVPQLASDSGLIDATLEKPIQPKLFIRVVAQLLGDDPAPLLEKYEKVSAARAKPPEQARSVQAEEQKQNSMTHITSNRPKVEGKPGEDRIQVTGNIKARTTALPLSNPRPLSHSHGTVSNNSTDHDELTDSFLHEDDAPAKQRGSVRAPSAMTEEDTPIFATVYDPILTPGTAARARTARSDRYDAYVREHVEVPTQEIVPHDRYQSAVRQLSKATLADRPSLEEIGQTRQEFVRSLFVLATTSIDEGSKTI